MTELSTDITPAAPELAKLRIYIGAAPGVGKTFQMLEDAHLMRKQGIDVVIGLIESHGRKDTQDQIKDLELIPRRAIPYRSVVLEEMDLDAILARHPQFCIVDELAHTNVPGSKNRKRYEDVLELLDAGINVMTAVNIQHLETLNDSVSRSADTQIRETIPDSFLKRADEVVNVDITVEELRSRLKQGKIYAAEKIEQSLANFFRKGNLSMLRELALRTTAEEVGSRAAEYRRSQGLEQAPIPEKVVVLKDKNVADALIEFAQQESISHVVFGQSARSRFDILLRGSVINRFLSEIRDATVQVVPIGKGKR